MNERQISRRDLIRLGAILGLGSTGASVVTACGGPPAASEGTKTSTGAAGGSAGDGPEVRKGRAIAKESEVKPNTAYPFTDAETGQQRVLVRLENGDLAAYSAVCTHQACAVDYQPETRKLACPCHGSVFDPAKGAAVDSGPATSPLPKVGIDVKEGEVFLA